MASRAANVTIRGYYYQFDTSILKILELTLDTDSITIEGVEDNGTYGCVQKKSFSKILVLQ
jgi:hypothetical protein